MADAAFLGLRATNDFTVDGQRPKNWRETILKLYPNGKAPLTALMGLMKSEKTTDPEFNWFTKVLPDQAGATSGIFSDAGLATAVNGAKNAGDTVYLKLAEADAKKFMASHTILMRSDTSADSDTAGIVEEVKLAGANSYVKAKLLENSSGTLSATTVKRLLIIGSANAEGAPIGQAIAYDPTKIRNYTQIFRNALEITRTAENTRLRTGPAYQQAKKETLELHSIEMEKAFIFGVPSENVGANKKPLRTTGGLIWAIKNYGGTTGKFTGTWDTDGQDWLDELMMKIFRFGETEKLAFVGDSALLAINKLARKYGTWNYTTATKAFGIQVVDLITPFGQLTMKTHPLFSYEPSNQKSMLIFEPKNLRYRYITDTTFRADDGKHGHNSYDGKKEEYLTEAGLEFHFPQSWAWLNNIGG